MSQSDDSGADVFAMLEAVLLKFSAEFGADLVTRLRQVVRENIRRGRLARFQRPPSNQSMDGYVRQVAQTILAEAQRQARLAAMNDSAWSELRELLLQRAYNRLTRIGVPADSARLRAEDQAQRTCLRILQAQPYPYDVPYLAWACKILNNSIAHDTLRSGDALDRSPQADPNGLQDDQDEGVLVDPNSMDQARRLEEHVALEWALAQLPAAQRTAIQRKLFEGIPDRDTAHELNVSPQAVYNLRHRGLKRLQMLLNSP
jgi:RNA polymerase sigma factor (sigma-70 family)